MIWSTARASSASGGSLSTEEASKDSYRNRSWPSSARVEARTNGLAVGRAVCTTVPSEVSSQRVVASAVNVTPDSSRSGAAAKRADSARTLVSHAARSTLRVAGASRWATGFSREKSSELSSSATSTLLRVRSST